MDEVELEPVDHTPDFEPATFDQRFNAAPATFDQRFNGAPVGGAAPVQAIPGQPVWGEPWKMIANAASYLNPISSAQAEESNPVSAAIMQHKLLQPAVGPEMFPGGVHPGSPSGGAALPGRIAQRLPTSTRNPLDEGGNIDLASMKADPKLFQKNTDLLRNYPNTTGEESQLSSDDLANAFIGHVKNNLLWLHDQVPEDIRQRSSLWYDGGNNIVHDRAQRYGLPPASVAGVIAAQSPQKDWYQNVGLADRLLDIYHTKADLPMTPQQEAWFKGSTLDKPEYQPMFDSIRGKSLNDIRGMDIPGDEKSILQAMWIRTHDEAHNPRSYNEVTPEGDFGPVITKADGTPSGIGWGSLGEISKGVRSIESNGDPALISQAMGERHKVRNFYNNLLHPNAPEGDTTIDTHAVAAGLLRPLSGNSLEVAHNFNNYAGKGQPGSSGSAITGVQGTYPLYAEAYRQAAAERGILPRQMQSITWEAVRGLFPDTFKTAKNNNLINTQWMLYRAGRQSLDDTRSNILGLAGGINPPSWYRPAGQADAAVRNPADTGELPQPKLAGQAANSSPRRGSPAGAQVMELR